MSKLSELRRTMIAGTLGLAWVGEKLPELIAAGLNVPRLNFTHGARGGTNLIQVEVIP